MSVPFEFYRRLRYLKSCFWFPISLFRELSYHLHQQYPRIIGVQKSVQNRYGISAHLLNLHGIKQKLQQPELCYLYGGSHVNHFQDHILQNQPAVQKMGKR